MFFDIGRVEVELDGGFQVGIEDSTEIAQVALTPYANGTIRAVIGDI